MSETAQTAEVLYHPTELNRPRKYEIEQDGLLYDFVPVFGLLEDDRYLQWIREFNIKSAGDEVKEEAREASCRLWDDVVTAADNLENDPADDWKPLVPTQAKIQSLNDFMAVAIIDADEKAKGKLLLKPTGSGRTIITEAWQNGDPVKQKHSVPAFTPAQLFELQKKYSRIQGKRFKQEQTKGLRRKPKVEFIPQDDKLGDLYNEMGITSASFDGFTPLRFKTAVIHAIFAEPLNEKK